MKPNYQVISSPNFDERPSGQAIEFLILHYTECDLDLALKILTDASSANPVSAHYVIAEDGQVFHLVDEAKRAWHAGQSFWAGKSGLNKNSIGIELVNPGHGPNYRPFSQAQMGSLIVLCKAIIHRYSIPARQVLGHSDIAPQRKRDPGELFDWAMLAKHCIGIDPQQIETFSEEVALDEKQAISQLEKIGYEMLSNATELQLSNVVRAFQRHYFPSNVNGHLCPATRRRINNLYKLINSSH